MRYVLALALCIVALSVESVYAQKRKSGLSITQLNVIAQSQYDAYCRMNQAGIAGKAIDRKKIFPDLYKPVRDWCQDNIKEYRRRSMVADNNATAAKKAKKDREAKRYEAEFAFWKEIYDTCDELIKAYEATSTSRMETGMKRYVSLERQAVKVGVKVLPRPWIVAEEAIALMREEMRMNKKKSAPYIELQQTRGSGVSFP